MNTVTRLINYVWFGLGLPSIMWRTRCTSTFASMFLGIVRCEGPAGHSMPHRWHDLEWHEQPARLLPFPPGDARNPVPAK